jgi:nitrate reductase NapAB chaperone NapD
MVICGYVVLTDLAAAGSLAAHLGAVPGCDVVPSAAAEILLLVTEAEDAEGDAALRRRIEEIDGVRALLLTFGNVAHARDA